MSPVEIGGLAIAALVVLIFAGMPIGVSMLGASFLGVAMIRGDTVALRMIGQVANDSLREYLFAVVPLFVLMGLLVTVSGVGKDTFDVFQRLLRRTTAGLGIATVFANAVFASITGISIMLILLPVAGAAGFDMIWFGVLTVVAVETGLLTPPFGLSVYTIKSAMDDPDLKVGEIFQGALPFVAAMLLALAIVVAFPPIATWLARL